MAKDIENREDIELLVDAFYGKIRNDELLGPIFNRHIADEDWPHHLSKLADFWETNLFGISKFKGSPTVKHMQVDQAAEYSLGQEHFGRWIRLWFETLDGHFEGEVAHRAKEAARRMAHGQFMSIWNYRPKASKS